MVVGAYAVLTGILDAAMLFVVSFEFAPAPAAEDWLELDEDWFDDALVWLLEPFPFAFEVVVFVLDELPELDSLFVDVITGATVVLTLLVFLTPTVELPEPDTEPPAPPAPPAPPVAVELPELLTPDLDDDDPPVALPPVAVELPPVAVEEEEPPLAVWP
jgi:hypothetical protein